MPSTSPKQSLATSHDWPVCSPPRAPAPPVPPEPPSSEEQAKASARAEDATVRRRGKFMRRVSGGAGATLSESRGRRRGRVCLGAGVALAVWCSTTFAQAAEGAPAGPITAHAEWVLEPSAADCLSRPALEREVERRLERRVFTSRQRADVILSGRLRRDGARWHARLALESASGEVLGTRDLVSETAHCSGLDETLVLVVALLVDLPRQAIGLRTPRDAPEPRAPWRAELWLGGGALVGTLPAASGVAAVAVAALPPEFPRFELGGFVTTASDATHRAGGARFRLAGARALLCPVGVGRAASLELCVGQHVARLDVQAFGYVEPRATTHLLFAVSTAAHLGLRLSDWLGVRAGLSVGALLSRPRFVVENPEGGLEEVFRPALAQIGAEAGVGVRF